MEKIKIKIRGIVPLLMNRYNNEVRTQKKTDVFDVNEEVKRACYYDEKLGYYAPSSWIEGAIREAAKSFKGKGKQTLKNMVIATVFCNQDKISLNKKYDEIDSRFARIQRQGIVKSRPKWNTWELEFILNFDADRISKETLLEIIAEAGEIKGIGDYRPKFGRFKIIK